MIQTCIEFQFTLPRGERLLERGEVNLTTEFQFTLPRGERPGPFCGHGSAEVFQFTLPRGERQGWNKARGCGGLIPCSARSIAQIELSKIGNGGGDFCCL